MVTLRPLLTADIPAHAALLAAVEAVERTGEHYNEADLVEEYANPDITLGHDVIGAFEGDELVGVATVLPRGVDATHQKLHLDGTVSPARRGEGIGTRLVTAMLARADVVHAERYPQWPAHVRVDGLRENVGQQTLLGEFGLHAERWSFSMRTQLATPRPTPPAVLPAGLTLSGWSPGHDRAVHEAHNEAFLDHPDFTPWTDVMWEQWVTGSRNARPALSVLVVEDGAPERVVAYVQTNEFDAYVQATGRREAHLSKVGTRREWRGRGVAGAMLSEVLRRCREDGVDEASLAVDSANPTGALGVYERAGFEVEHRWTSYGLERPPVR